MLKRFAILGAAGDLTSRLLLPALADLLAQGRLPGGFEIVGVGLEPFSTETFARTSPKRSPSSRPRFPRACVTNS